MPRRSNLQNYPSNTPDDYAPPPALDDALAAAWPLAQNEPRLTATLEHLDNYPQADHGRHAGPAHYRTNQERILYALASASEHPDSDPILDWHRQYGDANDTAPNLADLPRALAYAREQILRQSPETDAAR